MNFLTFDKIAETEKINPLKILFLNTSDVQVSLDNYIKIKEYASELFVVCKSNLQMGYLRSRLNSYGIKFVLAHQIPPTIKFNVVISTSNELTNNKKLINYFKFDYAYILDDNYSNSLIEHYYVFGDHCLKYNYMAIENNATQTKNQTQAKFLMRSTNGDVFTNEEDITSLIAEDEKLSQGDYEIFIKDFAVEPIKYDKYRINYLKPVVPGKVSIVMTITKINDQFPNVIRDLKSQEAGLVEYIIIDNAAGFRNNIKPNIRYGERMPLSFCEYHAKELCTGEYMIFLTEDSETFIISDFLEKGLYEIR